MSDKIVYRYVFVGCNTPNCEIYKHEYVSEEPNIRMDQCPYCHKSARFFMGGAFIGDQQIAYFKKDGTLSPLEKQDPNTASAPHKAPPKGESVRDLAYPTITCPYCKSTNRKKLGALSRGLSFGLFGFGSGKIGKQWHCSDCGSDF